MNHHQTSYLTFQRNRKHRPNPSKTIKHNKNTALIPHHAIIKSLERGKTHTQILKYTKMHKYNISYERKQTRRFRRQLALPVTYARYANDTCTYIGRQNKKKSLRKYFGCVFLCIFPRYEAVYRRSTLSRMHFAHATTLTNYRHVSVPQCGSLIFFFRSEISCMQIWSLDSVAISIWD